MTDDATSETEISCSNCGDEIDTREDTHYRVHEEERPVDQLEKDESSLEMDDFTSRGWFLCSRCATEVVPA